MKENRFKNVEEIIKRAAEFQKSLMASVPMKNLQPTQQKIINKEFERLDKALEEINEAKELLNQVPISMSFIELKIKEYYIQEGLCVGHEEKINWFHVQLNTAYKLKEFKVFDVREKRKVLCCFQDNNLDELLKNVLYFFENRNKL